jgi:hypothetical protein
MKKVLLMSCATLCFASSVFAATVPATYGAYRDDQVGAPGLASKYDTAEQSPRVALQRRPSVIAFNDVKGARFNDVKRVGEATGLLQQMYTDAAADFVRLVALMNANGVSDMVGGRMPGVIGGGVLSTLNQELLVAGAAGVLAGDSLNDVVGKIQNAPANGYTSKFSLKDALKALAKFNAKVSADLADMGIDPR